MAASCSWGTGRSAESTTAGGTAAPATTQPAATTTPETAATTTTTTTSTTTTTTEAPRDCTPRPGVPPARIPSDDPVLAAVVVSRATFGCADHVTVIPAGDPAIDDAALNALSAGGPLLVIDGTNRIEVAGELARLEPETITVFGDPAVPLDVLAGWPVTRSADPPGRGSSRAPRAPEEAARIWLVADDAGEVAVVVGVAATATRDPVITVDGDDLRTMPDGDRAALRAAGGIPVTLVGPITGEAPWQLDVIRDGMELPGGGLMLFPDRRLVAFYGNPLTPVLGVLGEQGPDAAIDRMLPIVARYEADGIPAIPAFEIIVTVADSRAGADGDYSNEMDPEVIRPWIEAAAGRGVYVILDLQPGRTDFLTQAKYYEEFLRLPHVGLALDPEWRLEPDQLHLEQIGSVDAAEINTVVEWLADLVRTEHLPQKLLLLHQFRLSMITDRGLVETPPELAVAIQADGQGPIESKYETWAALTAGPEAERFWWGWKNFYDEDSPTPTPDQVLDLTPTAYYVSYQ